VTAPDDAKRDLIAQLQQLPMRHRWLRWAMLAASFIFSAASTYYFWIEVQQEARSSAETVAVAVASDVQSRIRAYGDVLFALRGLFDASDHVTRDDFHEFAQALSLGERYPGVTNISFAFRVPHAKKAEFERAVRAEKSVLLKGLPEFSIKPPGQRPEYAVLTYIEPMGKNVVAWGLDMNADPLRRSVMDRARDTGQMASTSGVTLVRDSNAPLTSTLLRLAVYRGGGVPQSLEERQRLYWGMVGSTLRVTEMIESTLSKEVLSRTRVRIYEAGAGQGAGALLFDSAAGAPLAFSGHAVTQRLTVADREWRLQVVPIEDPVAFLDKAAIAVILAATLAIGALLFWLITSLGTSESRGVQLAKRNREAALLRKFGENLQSCLNPKEGYEVIAKYMPELLPGKGGSLSLLDASRSRIESAITWSSPEGLLEVFSPNDCQAVRRGHLYHVADSAKQPNCRHFSGEPPRAYVCVPMTAQNEVIGTLHLQSPRASPQSWRCSEEDLDLINSVAEYVALAIAILGMHEKLREQATRDKLTGLYNRHYVHEWFTLELRRAQRHGRPVCALMLDIDYFKRVNDSFGHEAGDLVLRELAGALGRLGRKSDVVSRYGGEEFLMLLPECPLDAAIRKAELIRQEIEKLRFDYGGRPLGTITVSIGVAAFPDHAEDPDTLLRCADDAMYKAKQAGRNRVVAYAAEPQTAGLPQRA
jgi:diguanylate cyclase (GGDEF)-like protein